MNFVKSLFLLGLATGNSELQEVRKGFSLKLNRVTLQSDQSGIKVTTDPKKSKRRLHQVEAQDISMDIQNYANVQYLADVCFGNPPQLYKAAFDTGSSNTWLINPKGAYNSTSAEHTNQVANVFFGSGALQGHFVIDEVRIGNGCQNDPQKNSHAEGQLIDIKRQQIGVAEQVKGFRNIHFDAIVGMAYPSLAQQNVTTVFDNIMSEKVLSKNIFSFYVVDDREEMLGGLQSEISFGYIDSKKYSGEMKWHPVLFKYMYGIKLDDILVNNKSLNLGCSNKECLITIDSGTSHLAFPEWAIHQVSGQIPLQTKGIKCSSSETFGDLTFVINGVSYSLPNNDWTFEPEKGKDNNQICRAAIRERDLKKDMFVLGDIFLRKYYTVFDRDSDRVGLAEKTTINFKK